MAIPPSREAREAMWSSAGLVRTPERLRELLAHEHPLARLVAASALHREETRGAHCRADHPELDPDLDGRHTVVAAGSEAPAYESWS
jgi:L-aspartate oxidase